MSSIYVIPQMFQHLLISAKDSQEDKDSLEYLRKTMKKWRPETGLRGLVGSRKVGKQLLSQEPITHLQS